MNPQPVAAPPLPWRPAAAIFIGVVTTLLFRGYRFGESNHAVYLVDALRRLDPSLLQNDWWANSTLQYHFVFNALTAALMRLGIIEPAFLAGYLALAALLHVAWRRLTLALGGTDGTYLVSVALFYVLAGGLGLGMYHFLQDSAFLPSNIANVAMLWAIVFWITGRPALAGGVFGVAGLFHINHAVAAIGLWAGASFIEGRRVFTRTWWVGTILLLALSAVQIVPAARVVLARSGKLPLEEFVDLFVRLRHPHHFDPRAWHWGVWLAFLLPLPLAAVAARRAPMPPDVRRRAVALFALFSALTLFALAGAGFWFVSETLVQLNLYRFSIYLKLLSCIGAGAWLLRKENARWQVASLWAGGVAATGVGVAMSILFFLRHRAPSTPHLHNLLVAWGFVLTSALALSFFVPAGRLTLSRRSLLTIAAITIPAVLTRDVPAGVRLEGLTGDDAGYRELAAWARGNTPADAVFLVPPDEESFRVHARRAIVVNFKGVPQLSGELPGWRDRLQSILDLDTRALLNLPKPLGRTLRAIRARYDALPPEHHALVAEKYAARYVLLSRDTPPSPAARLVHRDSNGRYFLYDLWPEGVRPPP